MIYKVTRNSRVTEVNSVTERIVAAFNKSKLKEDVFLSEIISHLENESAKLTVAIKRNKAESKLADKDKIRDNIIRSLNYLIRAYNYHPNETIKTAAGEVDEIIEKYGLGVIHHNYATESSFINSLIGDLKDPELENTAKALPEFSILVTELEYAQDDFEATRIMYEERKAVDNSTSNATYIRKVIIRYINNSLVGYLNAMLAVRRESYGKFIDTINEIIDDNNRSVKFRNRKAEELA